MTRSNLLLASSSRYRDTGFLVKSAPIIEAFLPDGLRELLFIPFANAAKDYDDYEARVTAAFDGLGFTVRSIHHASDPVAAIQSAEAIAIGGGNTFALLSRLQEACLLDPIKQAVKEGKSYIGWSAGSNMACPTICTTNDMPICQPAGFNALALIPFQLNPHFISGKIKGQNGESREDRLAEFLVVHPGEHVLALPEGAALMRRDKELTLCGEADGILISTDDQQTIARGEDISWLLADEYNP